MEISIGEIIIDEDISIGNIELDVIKVFPELEDLEITPSGFEQIFEHLNSYGYDKITVKPVASDVIDITPSIEEQQYKGLFNTVNVKAMVVPNEKWFKEEKEVWT